MQSSLKRVLTGILFIGTAVLASAGIMNQIHPAVMEQIQTSKF